MRGSAGPRPAPARRPLVQPAITVVATLVINTSLISALLVGAPPATALPATGLTGSIRPAAAESPTLGSAREQAATLRRSVQTLEVQVEQATEAYDGARERLAAAVTARLLATQGRAAAGTEVTSRRRAIDARVRSIYESGGGLAMYATAPEGTSPNDVLFRYDTVRAVLGGDAERAASSDAALAAAERRDAELRAAAEVSTRWEAAVADRAAEVRRLLGERAAMLGAADADVVRLAEDERRAAQESSERAFRDRLATARAEAGGATTAGGAATAAGASTSDGWTTTAVGALAEARLQIGKPYQWGATGPDSFDCSGLTQSAYRSVGVRLPRVAADQWWSGRHVGLAELAPGDLLFWGSDNSNPATIHHVAIYAGHGRMIAAPYTGALVREQNVYLDGYFRATRPA